MTKSFLACVALCMGGCILVVEPSGPSGQLAAHGDDYHYGGGIWIDDYYVECIYNSYWNESHWYVEILVGSPYVYYADELDVVFYIDTWARFWTDQGYYGEYYRTFDSSYYHCYSSYSFDFVVTTDYGDSDRVTLSW